MCGVGIAVTLLCRSLHGIPVLIKNNIATMDEMNNTAGSYALLGAKVSCDSTIAAKLRKAGAVILSKTNLSQWANLGVATLPTDGPPTEDRPMQFLRSRRKTHRRTSQ
jgi:Asp-tRNA(Asn)/Glu-tRNA(Gln) amidotransferase A subunit family amidase